MLPMALHFTFFITLSAIWIFSGSGAFAQAPSSGEVPTGIEQAPVSWADSSYPEVDYTIPYARELHEAGAEFDGWWGTIKEVSEAGAADHMTAINFSAVKTADSPDAALLFALCSSGNLYLSYFPKQMEAEGALSGSLRGEITIDHDTPSDAAQWVATRRTRAERAVTAQIDNDTANVQLWRNTPTGNGIFVEGETAKDILSRLREANSLTIALDLGDFKILTSFKVAGAEVALSQIIDVCESGDATGEIDR